MVYQRGVIGVIVKFNLFWLNTVNRSLHPFPPPPWENCEFSSYYLAETMQWHTGVIFFQSFDRIYPKRRFEIIDKVSDTTLVCPLLLYLIPETFKVSLVWLKLFALQLGASVQENSVVFYKKYLQQLAVDRVSNVVLLFSQYLFVTEKVISID